MLSDEGVRVIREIVLKNEASSVPPAFARGMKKALRGLYYLSPFVRDFQNCPQLMHYFQQLTGEPLIPHCMFSNVPHVNISIERSVSKDDANVPMDPWHWDSVAYTGVILLNDMEVISNISCDGFTGSRYGRRSGSKIYMMWVKTIFTVGVKNILVIFYLFTKFLCNFYDFVPQFDFLRGYQFNVYDGGTPTIPHLSCSYELISLIIGI